MESDDGKSSANASDTCDYYLHINDSAVQSGFCSLDNPANLGYLLDTVQSTGTGNFIVDFSDDAAWTASNLSVSSIEALFDADRPEELSSRWLHLFYPYRQRSCLELLAKRYDFSPRLLALMSSDPKMPKQPQVATTVSKDRSKFWKRRSDPLASSDEIEELAEYSSISSTDSLVRGNLYRIADNVWHYSSVDYGRQYIAIGYNSLYGVKRSSTYYEPQLASEAPLPHCVRVWTWLLLCEDNTVISIHEDPFPFASGHFTPLQLRIIAETRRNLVNVFRSISLVHDKPLVAHNPMTLLPIRYRLGDTPQETAHRNSDQPGLLFYYLFENWHNSYMLVTRKESRYGKELAKLRSEMLETPRLVHIDRLDRIGKELGVLKRHYASYNRIIYRLLEPQSATSVSLQNSQVVSTDSQVSLNTVRPLVTEKSSLMGVGLSSAARVRFKRLRDLIDLYALSEVEEYIKQKESLVEMNFNLIAIKQSLDVDKLTRITLLLTKATILFLPVSLATSYFSTQLSNVEYTVTTYWVTFTISLVLSWLALILFGVMNGNVQSGEVLHHLARTIQAGWRRISGKSKPEGDAEQ